MAYQNELIELKYELENRLTEVQYLEARISVLESELRTEKKFREMYKGLYEQEAKLKYELSLEQSALRKKIHKQDICNNSTFKMELSGVEKPVAIAIKPPPRPNPIQNRLEAPRSTSTPDKIPQGKPESPTKIINANVNSNSNNKNNTNNNSNHNNNNNMNNKPKEKQAKLNFELNNKRPRTTLIKENIADEPDSLFEDFSLSEGSDPELHEQERKVIKRKTIGKKY